MSLNSVMDTSLSAMFMSQAGLATTSHNIANADRPGYSRQENILTSRAALKLPYGVIGMGVDVARIRRAQDEFLLSSLRVQTARRESYGAVDDTLYEIENILGSVDNDHLGNAISTFFNAWSDLATPPSDPSLKESVLSAAQSLVTDFHTTSSSLDDLARSIDQRIAGEIESLNRYARQVADLNGQIIAVEAGGAAANDLRDERDVLINQLSEIAEVTVHERDDGSVDLIMNGRTIVTRDTSQEFTTIQDRTEQGYRITVVTQGNLRDVVLPDGRLNGLLQARDTRVTGVREKLDAVAKLLIDQVNELHVQGETSAGTGMTFFSGDSMHTMQVTAAIADDASLIATSRSGEPGDNDIASEIADLANFGLGGGPAVGDRYRATLIDVASQRGTYEFLVDSQHSAVGAIEQKIASTSGVSMDEEGARMLRYQNTYNAAAKVITTVQEIYDSLLNMV